MLTPEFFEHAAFVCVDIQEGTRGAPMKPEEMPPLWKNMGFAVEDVNAASTHAWEVMMPNAIRVTKACRGRKLPMIFIHWGYLFEDGMDLDPEIRNSMIANHGPDPSRWSGYIGQPGSRPATVLDVQPGEYVLAKSGQDAFRSSNLEFVLRNLGAQYLIFIGGHTGACLGKTARSAKDRGFTTLCIVDATSDARESARLPHIEECRFDYVLTTDEFLQEVQPLD